MVALVGTYGSAHDTGGAWTWPLLATAGALIGILGAAWGAGAAGGRIQRRVERTTPASEQAPPPGAAI
ncbi:MAG: hypothetical protein QOE60_423 [Thermoleophilaceae bacterium]|nr:hypothetical protein [Thermoleophilaceae bacterium]